MTLWGIPLTVLTPSALLGIVVLMILLGKLVPRIFYKDKVDEAEKWRLAYEAEREARTISDAQTAQLLELAKTTHSILVAMFNTTEQVRQSGGADVALPTK